MEIPNEKKLSLLRRYPLETLVFILLGSVTYLFVAHFALEGEFRKYILTNSLEHVKVIEKNTAVIDKNTSVIIDNEAERKQLQSLIMSDKKNK
jgi:hypothetical protein